MPPISLLPEDIRIRDRAESDSKAIGALHMAAFAATPFGHSGEAELVRALHADGDVLVSRVAMMGDHVIGHAMFSRMKAIADGRSLSAAALGPVAILPDFQRRGFGAALITDGLDRLRAMDVSAVFVLGDPAYYERFGFSATAARPFVSPYSGPHFMAVFLDSAAAKAQSGRADYAPAFARLG